jgi:hypothetical protein
MVGAGMQLDRVSGPECWIGGVSEMGQPTEENFVRFGSVIVETTKENTAAHDN